MTERLLGPTGSPKRRRFLLLPTIMVAALSMFWIAGAQAVHDEGTFELEGNAVAGATGVGTGLDPQTPNRSLEATIGTLSTTGRTRLRPRRS